MVSNKKLGEISREMSQIIFKMENTKVVDKLFLEDGIEEEDIKRTIRDLNLE